MNRFYCFINGKIKKEPEIPDIGVAKKMANSTFFHSRQQIPQQTANSIAQCENLHAVEYCWHCRSFSRSLGHSFVCLIKKRLF